MVVGNKPKISPCVLKPNNSNVGSFANNRGFGDDVGSRKSPFAQKFMDINFNFIPVNFQSNLDRNKYGAVRLAKKGEVNVSKVKENRIFQFGETSFMCPNAEVQFPEKGIMQQKKPPDCVQKDAPHAMLELSTTMEGIMRGIEGEPDVEHRIKVMILFVGFMVDDNSGRNVINY